MARRTICTEKMIDEVCRVLENGNFVQTACDYVGISDSAYYKWVRRGEDELARMEAEGLDEPKKSEAIYVKFVERTRRARANARFGAVENIKKAGEEDWKASAWFLEHGASKDWGKVRHEVDVTSGGEKLEFRIAFPGENDADD